MLENKSDTNKLYTDSELCEVLEKVGITTREQEIQKAREKNEVEILYNIGETCFKRENYTKAYTLFYKAALHGHAEAQARVGLMYLDGKGVSQDFDLSLEWSIKAAAAGSSNGQCNIGELYFWGHGVSLDYKQSIDWYLKAANKGNAEAMHKMGWMYRHELGVTKDMCTAIEWYIKAANQGNANAQYSLGFIYQSEDGFKNLQKAVNWYQKAADNGRADAKDNVKKLNEQGYYAKEGLKDIQAEKEPKVETNQEDDASNSIDHAQTQSTTTTSNNDEHLIKLIGDEMKKLEKSFQSKINLMKVNNEPLQKELTALKKEKRQQNEEIKRLNERLAKLEAEIEGNINHDLKFDSSNNESSNEHATDHGIDWSTP